MNILRYMQFAQKKPTFASEMLSIQLKMFLYQ